MYLLTCTNHEQYICSSLLMLVHENTAVHCLFMLVHGALTNVNKIFYQVLVNVENNINKD